MKKSPKNLKHKPIFEICDYDKIDGQYKGNSDVHALSIGKAQWSDKKEFIPSIKVWRKKRGRWSRQSEETTLTRALDMATMVVQVLDYCYNKKSFEATCTPFGDSVKVVKADSYNAMYEGSLRYSLDNSKSDIESHVKMLEEALKRYRNTK